MCSRRRVIFFFFFFFFGGGGGGRDVGYGVGGEQGSVVQGTVCLSKSSVKNLINDSK